MILHNLWKAGYEILCDCNYVTKFQIRESYSEDKTARKLAFVSNPKSNFIVSFYSIFSKWSKIVQT